MPTDQTLPEMLSGAGMAGSDETMTAVFRDRVRVSPKLTAYREFDKTRAAWRDFSWQDMDQRVARMRAALHESGLRSGDRVAIAMPNSIDWVAADTAALSLGLVVVPLYLQDSAAGTAFILGHSGARLLVIDTAARWRSLQPHAASAPEIEHVWIRDGIEADADLPDRPSIASLANVLGSAGEPPAWTAVDADAVATIIYTSGTTGRPKGVMLSQRALYRNAAAVAKLIPPTPEDVFLSCLPLAHAFERTVGYYLPMLGACTVVYARSIESIPADLREQKPTVFLGVPRLYERAYAGILARARSSRLKFALLEHAARLGWQQFEAERGRIPGFGLIRRGLWSVLDRIAGVKVRAGFGGRLRVAVTGGAPLQLQVARFLIGLGVPIVEGYGLTETAPVVAANGIEDNLPGSVGYPVEGVEVKLSEQGELLVRSSSMMLGYWQAPEATADCLDREGWLRTGDFAELKEGRLFIKGRLKELIVLSTGKKVLPTDVEAAILKNPLFDNVLVVGEQRPHLSAILVINRERWSTLTRDSGIDVEDLDHQQAKELALGAAERELQDFARHARIRSVHLTFDPWTIDNGLLTPTLKTKRGQLEAKYASEIAALYSAGRPAATSLPRL